MPPPSGPRLLLLDRKLASPAELVEEARRGNEVALRALGDHWTYRVLYWARTRVRPEEDALDLAQDVLVVAFRNIEQIRDPACADAWLYGKFRGKLSDYRKTKRKRSELMSDALLGWVPNWWGAKKTTEHSDVWDVLETLADDEREALLLVYRDGYSQVEAADMMGIRRSSFQRLLARAEARSAANLGLSEAK